jgi:hypothetical protein
MPRPLMQAHPYHIRCMAMERLDRSFRLEEYAQLLERQVRSSCFVVFVYLLSLLSAFKAFNANKLLLKRKFIEIVLAFAATYSIPGRKDYR